MFTDIIINDFRIFKANPEPISLKLGKMITCLAGKNATGKSTLLAMIGNSCEIKRSDGVTVLGKRFQTIFSEIIKGDFEFDLSGSNKFEVSFVNRDGVLETRTNRITWQNKGSRFRVIPAKITEEGKVSYSKIQHPVIYLGLSRLFPFGESVGIIEPKRIRLTNEEKEWFIEHYCQILFMQDEIADISSVDIEETNVKKAVGISTENYSVLGNSAGQDNLGQILLAVLSFIRLKENDGNYHGGLLLIDEIETTLHPSAVSRLYTFLKKISREYKIQIIFTTHSETLLRDTCKEVANNNQDLNNNIELYYLSNSNRHLQISRNPNYLRVFHDLNAVALSSSRLKVYSEDLEARWFMSQILPDNILNRINLLNVRLGCGQIVDMYKNDIEYFSSLLIVLDGDAPLERTELPPNLKKNIVNLPGIKRPETIIYEYLRDAKPQHAFWAAADPYCFTYEVFISSGPETYSGIEREQYKSWFREYRIIFEQSKLMDFWKEDNPAEYENFLSNFKKAFNFVAGRSLIEKIPD